MGKLDSKYALVTGGAAGIGKGITEKFLSEGARIIIFDRDQKAIDNLKSDFRDTYGAAIGNRFQCYNLDISNLSKVNEIFESERLPKLDILVNNAGVDEPVGWLKLNHNKWNDIINTNINGTSYVTENILKQMTENNKKGSIIFITSIHNAQAFPGGAAYDTTKHALVGMMKNIALEFGKYEIRSNAIAPGSIGEAGPTANIPEHLKNHFEKSIPLGRLGTTEDIAKAAVFLASDDSSYMTGEQIRVDGGSSIVSDLFNQNS